MTFIIALGAIIVLLCSASIFKLMQPLPGSPRTVKKTKKDNKKQKQKKTEKKAQPTQKSKQPTVKRPASEPAFDIDPQPGLDVSPEPTQAPVSQPAVELPEVITLNLAADPGRPYAGYELLQTLLTAGMRFGEMSLFHRHEKKTGVGSILFSLAACTADGSFELTKIGEFSCNGLVLFMKPRDVSFPSEVFELMLKTADQLIQSMGGKVLNGHQQLLTKTDVVVLYNQLQQREPVTATLDE